MSNVVVFVVVVFVVVVFVFVLPCRPKKVFRKAVIDSKGSMHMYIYICMIEMMMNPPKNI